MASVKLSALVAIAAASISATDILPITDADAGTPTTYKTSISQLRTAVLQASIGSGWGATDYLGLGAGTVPSTGMIRSGQGAIVADTPLINSTATWNNVAITFRHILVNITDTTSAAASLFADFQIAGASKWNVTKGGAVTQALGLTITSGGLIVSSGTTAVQAITGTTLALTGDITLNNGQSLILKRNSGGAAVVFARYDVGTDDLSTILGGLNYRWRDTGAGTYMVLNATTGLTVRDGLVVTTGGVTVSAGTTAVQALTATTGTFTAAGQAVTLSSAATAHQYARCTNTGGEFLLGVESSVGGAIFGSTAAYSTAFGTTGATNLYLTTNNTIRLTITSAGAISTSAGFTVASGLTVTASGLTVSAGTTAVQALTATTGVFAGAVSGITTLSIGGTLSGVTTLTCTTVTATNLGGTLSTAAQTSVTSVGTLTSLTTSGAITFTAAAGKIVPGATSISHRNTADNADNLIITDAGAVTIRSTLTVSAGGVTVTAGGVTVTGASTITGTLGGVTTLTCTTVTATNLGGTLSTAAQTNVTSLGTLTGLTLNGDLVYSNQALTRANTAATSVTTIPIHIYAAPGGKTYSRVEVFGSDGTNAFRDIVLYGTAVTVVSSTTIIGAPTARTYAVATQDLTLAMASGTYTIRPHGISG